MPLYRQDPNDSTKQIPNYSNNGISRHSHATCPVQELVVKRPTHVVINQPGSYAFLYETTSSAGGSVPLKHEAYYTGSIVPGDADAGTPSVKLDISPVAWKQNDADGTVGDVTFVYVKVR